ncbi:sigma-54 dependent transcriptional regulator [bacterium]|nr:sigma-54 dependent transcriptional regulator [bacterium]
MNSQNTITKSSARILVVDDNLATRRLYGSYLRDLFQLTIASDGNEALEIARKQPFDLYITDLMMPGIDGVTFIKKLRKFHPTAGVIVVSQTEEIDLAIGAFRQKLLEFLRKPIRKNLLINAIERNLELSNLRENVSALQKESSNDPGCPQPVIGESALMIEFWDKTRRVAEMELAPAIMITGESGCGKEVVARQIHKWSARSRGPLISVNCGLLTAELAASELMGIIKGIATGVEARKGKFAMADGGTIFLDEIAELPLEIQPMLLRVLQEHVVTPVGTTDEIPVNVRVMAATNKDLGKCVAEGTFREDLFYRLTVVTLQIPSLRERREDIPSLLMHLYRRHGGSGDLPLSGKEMDNWSKYHWPGNVRQLESALINRMIMGKPVEPELSAPMAAKRDNTIIDLTIPITFDEIRHKVFTNALNQSQGNIREAARRLGIAKSTLWEYCRKHQTGNKQD